MGGSPVGDADDEGAAVGVGIGSDDEVDVDSSAFGDGQIQGAGLLGVGERNGGEVRVAGNPARTAASCSTGVPTPCIAVCRLTTSRGVSR